MKYKVYLSDKAVENLQSIVVYLKSEWPQKVLKDFFDDLDKVKSILSKYPESFEYSKIKKGIYRCVLSKHNTLFYRINKNEVEIIVIFDTRQNQKKLRRRLK